MPLSDPVNRTSILAPLGPGGLAAAAGDGGVWTVWPTDDREVASEATAKREPIEPVPWDDLMRRHGRRVVVALVSRGVPLERAKELAQDAWMRVIDRHRAGLIRELSLPGLIIAQAGFLARDDMRREQRRARLDSPYRAQVRGQVRAPLQAQVQASANDVSPDLEQQLDARQRLRAVQHVLDGASPNAQRVFALLFGERACSPAEAAQELGLSVQRVRQIVCELRKRMRAALAEPSLASDADPTDPDPGRQLR